MNIGGQKSSIHDDRGQPGGRKMNIQLELPLFDNIETSSSSCSKLANLSTFVENMQLPVHRWFRYSAGFSSQWVEQVIKTSKNQNKITLLDPFAGSGTTLLVAEKNEVECYGIEAHPFIFRIAKAKLLYHTEPELYLEHINKIKNYANSIKGYTEQYPPLIQKCFTDDSLEYLDRLRRAWEYFNDDSSQSQLAWLTLIAILRSISHVGTAPWQYILPNKLKKNPLKPDLAFELMANHIAGDMKLGKNQGRYPSNLLFSDARTCLGVPDNSINLVITSPPYANNYDYADATRLEMCFMGEINHWGDLQKSVRQYLIRSCSQHVTHKTVNLEEILQSDEILPIKSEIATICHQLYETRQHHGGRKNYHLMIACYFLDMAKVWYSLRRVCQSNSTIGFVIGDSAPYGIYVPVIEWLGCLAESAGFSQWKFEKTRDRNTKWKNRKHQVPLCEGVLWVYG